jgi:hypothetical protein
VSSLPRQATLHDTIAEEQASRARDLVLDARNDLAAAKKLEARAERSMSRARALGMSTRDVGALVGWSFSKVSRRTTDGEGLGEETGS